MGGFPSGQREQTVNLSSMTSVVRIHHLPPESKPTFSKEKVGFFNFLLLLLKMVQVRNGRFLSFFCHFSPEARDGFGTIAFDKVAASFDRARTVTCA